MDAKKYAILAFGGVGSRFGWSKPKQFYPIKGEKTILEYLVEKFLSFSIFDEIVVLSPPTYIEETSKVLSKLNCETHKVHMLAGGDTREHSVWNGISFLKNRAKEDDIVLIHDGARPLVSKEIIIRNIELCNIYGSVVTAISSTDTVSYSEDGLKIGEIVERSKIYMHQTPQTFRFGIIYSAMESNIEKLHVFSDDASIVLASGYEVYYAKGHRLNLKVTTMEDLDILKYIVDKGGDLSES